MREGRGKGNSVCLIDGDFKNVIVSKVRHIIMDAEVEQETATKNEEEDTPGWYTI